MGKNNAGSSVAAAPRTGDRTCGCGDHGEAGNLADVAQSRSTASLFDRWSVSYDRPGLQLFTYRPIHDVVLARVSELEPSTVVDLGCGTGQLTQRLIRRFPDATIVGIDLSDGMLSEAAGRMAETRHGTVALTDRVRVVACPGDSSSPS